MFLTEGIGDGTVRLDNVTVQGQTFVNGGGDHSVVINNSSLQGILYVYKSNGQVRILAEGSTYIPNVQLGSGANLESENASNNSFGMVEIMAVRPGQPITLDGDFTAVYLEAAGADLRVVSGSVGTLFVGSAGTGANIEVETNANIATLTADGRATVSGPGTIATANINTNGVTIESKPVKTNLASGVTAEIGGITTTGSTLPASSGGDGGSSTPASPDQDIASAKALLPGTFYAVEGTDLNIIHSLGNITGIAATSVTLAVYSTGNSQVSSNGVITYGGESVTGNVTISLAKAGGTTDKKVILVIIPAHISPTASGILYIDTDRWVQGDTGKLYLVKL